MGNIQSAISAAQAIKHAMLVQSHQIPQRTLALVILEIANCLNKAVLQNEEKTGRSIASAVRYVQKNAFHHIKYLSQDLAISDRKELPEIITVRLFILEAITFAQGNVRTENYPEYFQFVLDCLKIIYAKQPETNWKALLIECILRAEQQ